ncbi:MAG: YraN family protein [Clostridia bacterium]|nr:YraN family protein [Clostridia bacterium]
MRDNLLIGKKGEDITAEFLRKKGFIIFKRNYHSRFGEIDIIAEKDTLLLFVEVKTRYENALVLPAEAVDSIKQHRIKETAKSFLSKTFIDYTCRFDVAEVTVSGEEPELKFKLNYIKNAFL